MTNDNPWPLVVVCTTDIETERNYPPDVALESAMTMLRLTARKELEKAGRLGDVRSLKLYVYNHDITNQPTGEGNG